MHVPLVTTLRKCAQLLCVSTLHEEPVRSKEVLWEFRQVEARGRQGVEEKGMWKTVRERKVKFLLCAESGLGKLHIMKNGTMLAWSPMVTLCVGGVPKGGQMQKVSATVGRGLDSPRRSLFQAELNAIGLRLVSSRQVS